MNDEHLEQKTEAIDKPVCPKASEHRVRINPLEASDVSPSDQKRFWSKVDKNGPTKRADSGPCWEWKAALGGSGYGRFAIKNRIFTAHRIAFVISNPDNPPGKEFVLHKCDNPLCVNPGHLFLGSHQDNWMDCKQKDRLPHGERHCCAKLTEDRVKSLRRDFKGSGVSKTQWAKNLGVSRNLITQILNRECWAHI